ncbi:hypothetical protein [Altericista sp. CCNU0014]|uniref:hypothetical protein n=1 Tax=Altericista sp. CCNU0014 TaxID=3082949 RepID=UPI00384FFD85
MKIQNLLAQAMLPMSILALVALAPLDAIAKPAAPSKIPGTAVQIAPPEGFQPSKLFLGFEQQQTGASIFVTELPIPKAEVPKVLEKLNSTADLQSRGMRLIESQEITVGSIPGKLLLVSQSNRGIDFLKWLMVVAQGDRVLIVTASFPEDEAAKLKEPLRQSVIGLTWSPGQPAQLLEGLPFTFQPAGDLQVSGRVSNNVVLTRNGMKAPIPASEPLLILGSAYDTVRIRDVAKFSRMRLKALPQVRDLTEVSGNSKTIAGHPAFELVARGYDRKTNTPLTVYQAILATKRTYYVLEGLVPNPKAKAYLPIFRAVADTLVPQL